ncbi:MAG: helix-turn-helix transcriptional regulator [Herpetosiphonaceae bacterium]|nr:helix-turn-helix transcriptional regulator [Herpetosiphonaceae bacterium]
MLDKLGARIAHYRTALGWTQQELADRIAASRTAISHFEMDLAVPSERTIVLLAGLFRCEPHALVANTYYPAAKSERLPAIAARYTEVEKELCLLEHDLNIVAEFDGANDHRWQTSLLHWQDRLLALHASTDDTRERHILEAALHKLNHMCERHRCGEESHLSHR